MLQYIADAWINEVHGLRDHDQPPVSMSRSVTRLGGLHRG
jgi:hypothetical protein